MTNFTPGTLVEGRLEVGNRIRFKSKDFEGPGTVCETQRVGKERPCAVLKVRDGSLHSVRFENVTAGSTIRSPEKSS
jgi:hypothetical protein